MKQCRQWQACDTGTEEGAAGREALLSRLVEQLKGRLQALKEENQQLEDMLHQSDSRASGVSSTTAYSLTAPLQHMNDKRAVSQFARVICCAAFKAGCLVSICAVRVRLMLAALLRLCEKYQSHQTNAPRQLINL